MKFNHESSSTAKAGLTTGIIGTALGAMNALGGLGAIALNGTNVPNNPNCCCQPHDCCNPCCNEDHVVDRYALEQSERISKLESEKEMLMADQRTDKKILDLYQFTDRQLRQVREELCDQKVVNQKTADSFTMLAERFANSDREIRDLIKQECQERKCADNTIVTYVNATFVPITVAQPAVGTETYMQPVYNPLPMAGCGNKC